MNGGRILTGCLGWDKLPPRTLQPLHPAAAGGGGHGSNWRSLELGGGGARTGHHQGPRAYAHLLTTCGNTHQLCARTGPGLVSRRMKTRTASGNMESAEELNRKSFGDVEHDHRVGMISPDSEPERVYEMYRRSGFKNLSNQQVRRAAFGGPYIQMLDELASYKTMKLIRREENVDPKEADRELILRFFAMYNTRNMYKAPMYKFLNDHLYANRKITEEETFRWADLFKRTIDTVFLVFGDTAFRKDKNSKAIDTALWDMVLLVFATYDTGDFVGHHNVLRKDLETLISDPSFSKLLRGSLTPTRLSERVFMYEKRVRRIMGFSTLEGERTYPFDLKATLYERYNMCNICGADIGWPEGADVRHIIPVAEGGDEDDLDNLELVHFYCNN